MHQRPVLHITRPVFDEREIESVADCLRSGWVTQGPRVDRFEALFAERHAVGTAIATTSCTAALHLATVALDLQPGDEVIVPAFTWVTSASCVEYVGARPVFVDIDPATYNLDPAAVDAAITPRTRAIMVVHLFGLAAPMDELMAIANRHDLRVIEDAACAVGTTYDDRPVGGIGDIGCFSFHPRKVITTGEGGMVTTNDADLARRVRITRNHGATPGHPGAPSFPHTMGSFDHLGYNLRLSDVLAAIGVIQMERLDELLAERLACGQRYLELLADLENLDVPEAPPRCGHTYQSFVVRLRGVDRETRNAVMEAMAASGVQTRPGTHAVHRLGYFRRKYDLQPDAYPHSVAAEDLTITLPLLPGMHADDQVRVVDALRAGMMTSCHG